MDQLHYEEMVSALDNLEQEGGIQGKRIYLFGHCNATEELADLLMQKGYYPIAILDNNKNKYGNSYMNIPIVPPQEIISDDAEQTIVCIAARAYAAMSAQLKGLGYNGQVRKLVDYNSYAEYSLSDDTISRMKIREVRGEEKLAALKKKYPDHFLILCPFSALGDIYFMMSYLSYFLLKRRIEHCVICVVGNACAQVVCLFGEYPVEILSQKDMDEIIQAALFMRDEDTFIPHQDRPYVVNLYKALYVKLIPLEQIYCCGVFGLPANTKAIEPKQFRDYGELDRIEEGNAVIFSPYAKSVTSLPESVWKQIVDDFKGRGYQCFTNVVNDEVPLKGTIAISPQISELKSVVERAGTFVGIRSGLCDILKTVKANRIALYPDYNYCDTKWKAVDMYSICGWENIVVKDGLSGTSGMDNSNFILL